jgi:hypothetical protein
MGEMSKLGWLIGWATSMGWFPVGGVRFNLQELRIFPPYFVAFFVWMLAQSNLWNVLNKGRWIMSEESIIVELLSCSKISHPFMNHEGSLLDSQEPVNGLYSDFTSSWSWIRSSIWSWSLSLFTKFCLRFSYRGLSIKETSQRLQCNCSFYLQDKNTWNTACRYGHGYKRLRFSVFLLQKTASGWADPPTQIVLKYLTSRTESKKEKT